MVNILTSTNRAISERERRNSKQSKNIAATGMVLLENHGGLPLQCKDKKIALFGNGVRNIV